MSPLRALLLGASVASGVAGAGLYAALRLSQKRVDAERAALETSSATLRKRNEQLANERCQNECFCQGDGPPLMRRAGL